MLSKNSYEPKFENLAPPRSPHLSVPATTTNSITMKLSPHPTDSAPLHGYTIHYKPEFGEWETLQVASLAQKYTLENLWCGSRYQIYVTAYNRYIGGRYAELIINPFER